jgi:hypothetical protein
MQEPTSAAWEALQGKINSLVKAVFFQVTRQIAKFDYT